MNKLFLLKLICCSVLFASSSFAMNTLEQEFKVPHVSIKNINLPYHKYDLERAGFIFMPIDNKDSISRKKAGSLPLFPMGETKTIKVNQEAYVLSYFVNLKAYSSIHGSMTTSRSVDIYRDRSTNLSIIYHQNEEDPTKALTLDVSYTSL